MQTHKSYSDEQKARIVIEVLREEKTINEIARHYNVHPKTVQQWRRSFISNAHYAINPNKCSKQQKYSLKEKDKHIDELQRQ